MPDQILDIDRWAVVGYKDETGIGRMAEDYKQVLGICRQIVIPSERLQNKPLDAYHDIELKPDDPISKVQNALQGLQGILFFERPGWHPQMLPVARKLGIHTVCVPMWEWFKANDPLWQYCDLLVCPNKKCYQTLHQLGYKNTALLPTVLDLATFPSRSIHGPARVFIHNAGLIDYDDRKGTRDVVRAFRKVRRQDVRLIIRVQKQSPLLEIKSDERIDICIGNLDTPALLYQEGDVAVQPSKMEGIGFMVLEPVCCGLPVITLDYEPMNEFVQQPEMRVQKLPFARRAFPSHWIKQAHLRLPSSDGLTRCMEWCAENDLSAISRENRRWAEETFNSARLKQVWWDVLQKPNGHQSLNMPEYQHCK